MKREEGNVVEKQQGNMKEELGNNCSKESADRKVDYIHVRARRGQATDSHSLAERVSVQSNSYIFFRLLQFRSFFHDCNLHENTKIVNSKLR